MFLERWSDTGGQGYRQQLPVSSQIPDSPEAHLFEWPMGACNGSPETDIADLFLSYYFWLKRIALSLGSDWLVPEKLQLHAQTIFCWERHWVAQRLQAQVYLLLIEYDSLLFPLNLKALLFLVCCWQQATNGDFQLPLSVNCQMTDYQTGMNLFLQSIQEMF